MLLTEATYQNTDMCKLIPSNALGLSNFVVQNINGLQLSSSKCELVTLILHNVQMFYTAIPPKLQIVSDLLLLLIAQLLSKRPLVMQSCGVVIGDLFK